MFETLKKIRKSYWTTAVYIIVLMVTSSCLSQNTIDMNYGTKGKDGLRNLMVLDDGGYLLSGWVNQTTKNHVGDGYLLNIDPNGNERWQQTIRTNSHNRITNTFKHKKGFLIVMEEFPMKGDLGQVVLMELDSLGNTIKKHQFGGEGADIIETMRKSADGGYFFVGESSTDNQDSNRQAWVGKLSPDLRLQWQRHFGGLGNDRLVDFTILPDDTMIAVGYIEKQRKDSGFYDSPWLTKLNAEGKTIWSKEPDLKKAGALRGIALADDGQLALTGYVRNYDGSEFDAWVGIATTNGDLKWQHTFPKAGFNSLMAVEKKQDGTFIAIGSTKNSATEYDALLVSFSIEGNAKWASISKQGRQFGRVLKVLKNDTYAIGGFHMQDENWGDQLWFNVTDSAFVQKE